MGSYIAKRFSLTALTHLTSFLSLVQWTQQVVTLVQNDAFFPHPIRREFKPMLSLFTHKNLDHLNLTYQDKPVNISLIVPWMEKYYESYCELFSLQCNLTGCGINDNCEAGQVCHDVSDGRFECGQRVAEIHLEDGRKYFGEISEGEGLLEYCVSTPRL